ncbi:odorant receptor 82a-like [Colletes gigas]|uniref:odorant receptor 82a-like n=1 Tax=Colletes gigas TaxID=935657 RepID=UPI001C9A6F2A|nr:odorant receptor 82a-like [Colletes gigas]
MVFSDLFERPSKMKKNKDFEYAMVPLRILSWPVGTWPLQKYNLYSAFRSIASIIFLAIMVMIVQMEVYLDVTDAEKNLDALVLIGCGILAVSKVAKFRFSSEGLVTNFSAALKDYDDLGDVEKRAIVRHHAYMGRVACMGVVFFSCMSSSLFTIVSIVAGMEDTAIEDDNGTQGEATDYPIPSELTFESLRVPENYYLMIFFVEYSMLVVTAIGNLGSDGLFFGITFHLCGQAEVLKFEFRKLVENGNTANSFSVLAKRHRHLLKMAEKLNDIIRAILSIQLFTSCLLICTTGFQFILSLNVRNMVMVMKTFIVMGTVLMQLFAYSYVGEYLKNQMEEIGYAAYCSSWYNIPSYVSRDIVFVLRRTQDPVCLKTQQFFIVNMQTYMSIVKTSMSYLSVLRVMITT